MITQIGPECGCVWKTGKLVLAKDLDDDERNDKRINKNLKESKQYFLLLIL